MTMERQLAKALNNLLALWAAETGHDWADSNAVDAALHALARVRAADPAFPVTALFADEVERRAAVYAAGPERGRAE